MEDLTPEKGSRILSSENLVVLDSVLEDEGIKIDNDDMDQYQKLVDWLIRSADIVPSQARKYGQVLLDEGIASTERLQKKLQKDPQILIKLGIKEDDIEEIFISLQRMTPRSMSNPPTKRSASLSGPEHAPKQDVIAQQQPTPLNLTTVEIPSTLIASLVNSNTRRSPSRSRAGSEFHISPRTPTKELEEEFRLKIRRLKHSVQLKPPSESALRDAKTIVNDLAAALEVKMETAVIGVLTTINNAVSIPGVAGGEALRALFKQGCAQVIVETLLEFNASTSVCEKVLKTMALMCRPHDDNKASASLENAKAFGIADGAAAIAKTLLKHVNESTVLETACDAVRSMCVLPSNRTRFGDAGVCDIIARALGMKRFAEMAETCCWICRALGHLAKENEQNCERLGSVGVCETAVSALQIHTMNSSVCREVCWVLRTVAPLEGNRGRILDQFGPEKIISVFKSFHKDLEFSLEACKVVLSLIASEEDEVIVRITNAGIVSLILKALRRYTSSDQLSTAAFNVFYFISCDDKLRSKLCNSELFDLLSLTLEEHAGDAGMAEWGCRTVHNLVQVNGMAHRMKNAGLCEMVVSCVQRQAISATVCGYGCLAIGDLAMDKANHTRLTDSGACEAVVGSLRRHDGSPDVVFQTCYAIHYLAATENNVGWIGANGGCEAITTALAKHIITSVDATRGCLRAIGSLAISNEGNMAKFHSAGACEVVVAALRSHGLDVITAESAFRAIYNLSPETNNVSEFGAKGACGLIAAGLLKHQGSPAVLTQACLATYALAVKIKVDKVHNGNTRKLVAKGAIESVISAMKTYPRDTELQRACAMALASLSRLESNREKIGSLEAIDLILLAFTNHAKNGDVIAMLATATERLCVDSEANQLKFLKAQIVEVLLSVITKHEKNAAVVGESFRALVTLSSVRPCPQKIRTEESFRIYVHGLRVHDKSEYVARWGCNLIYSCAVDDHSRMILGSNRACEAVIVALQKHSNQSAVAALWGCKALVALSVLDSNKSRFINSETCVAVVKALEAHQDDAASSEWVCAAVVSLGTSESNRLKLNGACSALCQVLKKQMATSEIVTRLACEAIYELCVEEINRQSFAAAGASELLVHNLNTHMHDVKVSQQVCRAIAGFSNVPVNSTDFSNPTSLGANGCCQALFVTMRTHSFSPPLIEWACASIAAVTDRNATNQSIFLDMVSKDSTMNIFKLITFLLSTHRTHLGVCYQACRAVRSLCQANVKMVREFSAVGIVPVTMKVLKTHKGVDNIVEFACWMLTYIVAPEFAPEDEYNPTLSPSQSQANLIDLDTAIVSQPSVTTTDSSAAVVASGAVPISEISTKVPQIATSRKSSPSRGVTNLLPIASAPRSATTIPNSFDLYRDRSNWEVLLQALQTNMLKPIVARWICAAISVFADIGKLSHLELCDSVLTMLTRHMDKDYVLMRGLQAVGKLADCHPDNKLRLVRGQAIETIDRVLATFNEGEAICQGVFCAIAGLAKDSPVTQAKFNTFPNLIKNVIQFLYHELESESVSLWGCAAVAFLAHKNRINQSRLSPVCNYLADILEAHYKSRAVTKEACRAITALCHMNIANRNKMGAAEVCAFLPKAILQHIDDIDVTVWSVRAVADLAANHPNNQTKLGGRGTCEGLIKILKKIVNSSSGSGKTHILDDSVLKENIKLAMWTCWAIGNIVQLGKGSGTIMDESGAPSNSMRGKVLPVVGRVTTRNTDSFGSVGAADVLVRVLIQYDFDVNVVQWAARAINNLSKSRSLKSEFLKSGSLEALNDVFAKYEGNKDAQVWIKQALETLQSASTIVQSSADKTPYVERTAAGMTATSIAAMSFTTEKISTTLVDLLNMNSTNVSSNVSGSGGGIAAPSVEKSTAKKRQSPAVNTVL